MADRIALISDIHSEHNALAALEHALEQEGITRIWNLGDSVDWLLARDPLLQGDLRAIVRCRLICELLLGGNHEWGMLQDSLGREQLSQYGDDVVQWLTDLEARATVKLGNEEVRLVHGSLCDPRNEFVETEADVRREFALANRARLILFGHTHLPFFACSRKLGEAEILRVPSPGVEAPLKPGFRYLVNPGSLGRSPVPGLGSWAVLTLDDAGEPVSVSWRHTGFTPGAF